MQFIFVADDPVSYENSPHGCAVFGWIAFIAVIALSSTGPMAESAMAQGAQKEKLALAGDDYAPRLVCLTSTFPEQKTAYFGNLVHEVPELKCAVDLSEYEFFRVTDHLGLKFFFRAKLVKVEQRLIQFQVEETKDSKFPAKHVFSLAIGQTLAEAIDLTEPPPITVPANDPASKTLESTQVDPMPSPEPKNDQSKRAIANASFREIDVPFGSQKDKFGFTQPSRKPESPSSIDKRSESESTNTATRVGTLVGIVVLVLGGLAWLWWKTETERKRLEREAWLRTPEGIAWQAAERERQRKQQEEERPRKEAEEAVARAKTRRTLYDVLGVLKSASPDEIRKAYHRFARKYHPDRNPGDDRAIQKFKEVAEAYSILRDPEKRREYDRNIGG